MSIVELVIAFLFIIAAIEHSVTVKALPWSRRVCHFDKGFQRAL